MLTYDKNRVDNRRAAVNKAAIPVIIYGAGQNGRVALDISNSRNTFKVFGFIDDDQKLDQHIINGIPILGDVSCLQDILHNDNIKHAFVSIGDNHTRARKTAALKALGFTLINMIHDRAIISPDVQLSENIQIAPGAIINTGSIIGNNVILNTGASADHDNILGDSVHVCPGAHLAGNVKVGNFTLIGAGATVINGVTIGKNAIVGAGSVIINDVPDNALIFGVPGTIRNKRSFDDYFK